MYQGKKQCANGMHVTEEYNQKGGASREFSLCVSPVFDGRFSLLTETFHGLMHLWIDGPVKEVVQDMRHSAERSYVFVGERCKLKHIQSINQGVSSVLNQVDVYDPETDHLGDGQGGQTELCPDLLNFELKAEAVSCAVAHCKVPPDGRQICLCHDVAQEEDIINLLV